MINKVALKNEKKSNSPVVFSLVANAGTVDGRVMKQAKALQEAGFDIWLFGRLIDGYPEEEITDEINVRRIPYFHVNSNFSKKYLGVFGTQEDFILQATNEIINNTLSRKRAEEKYKDNNNRYLDKYRKDTYKNRIVSYLIRCFQFLGFSRSKFLFAVEKSKEELDNSRSIFLAAAEKLKASRAQAFYYNYSLLIENLTNFQFEVTPDIIHAHDLITLPAALALAQQTGAQVVFDAHEIESERAPPLPDDKKQFILSLEENLLKQADEMIVCCESAAEFYFDTFGKKRPVLVMNAPDDRYNEIVPAKNTDIRNQCKLDGHTPLVAYTGAIGLEPRGVDKIIEALQYLPEYHLAILGPRNTKSDNWAVSIAEKIDCVDRVHFLEPVSQENLIGTLRTADLGICAFQDVSLNHRYALPNKIFEMAFAGLPLCLSSLVEMTKFIDDLGIGVVMDETDPRAIADAITDVYVRKNELKPDFQVNKKLHQHYSWSVQSQRLINMYNNLITDSTISPT